MNARQGKGRWNIKGDLTAAEGIRERSDEGTAHENQGFRGIN